MGNPFDYNPIAQNYLLTRFTVPWVLEPLKEQIRMLPQNSDIIEIGCGTGNYITELSNNLPNNNYSGFDISDEMLKIAKSRSERVNFVKGDAEKAFPFDDESMTLCFAVDVIHHIVNIQNFFYEISRCLKPNGIFLLVTDLEENIKKRNLSKFFPEILKVELDRYPSKEEILYCAEKAGINLKNISKAEGFFDINDEFVEKVKNKCASSMWLITDEQHIKGLERIIKAKEKGEKWLSSYSIINFKKE